MSRMHLGTVANFDFRCEKSSSSIIDSIFNEDKYIYCTFGEYNEPVLHVTGYLVTNSTNPLVVIKYKL